jgi:hypothetical protein
MFTHEYNVYEIIAKLDSLLESSCDDASPMSQAELRVLTSSLVRAAIELLTHLAMHDVLALESVDSYEPIMPKHISSATVNRDGPFSDEIVSIDVPTQLVPYGAILESVKSWNVGTVETVADLSVMAQLWARYLIAAPDSNEESATFAEWSTHAQRLAKQCLPAVQRLDAAGILRVKDLRTDLTYALTVARSNGLDIELSIATDPEAPVARRKAPTRKRSTRKSSR